MQKNPLLFSRAGFYLYGNVESPLGSARGATSAPPGVQPNIVRRAKPRREMYCKPLPLGSARGAIVYSLGLHPSSPLGVQPNIVRRAKPRREMYCKPLPLGSARGAIVYALGVQPCIRSGCNRVCARGAGKLRRSGITIAPSGRHGQRLVL